MYHTVLRISECGVQGVLICLIRACMDIVLPQYDSQVQASFPTRTLSLYVRNPYGRVAIPKDVIQTSGAKLRHTPQLQ
jgi:hypothetical protein